MSSSQSDVVNNLIATINYVTSASSPSYYFLQLVYNLKNQEEIDLCHNLNRQSAQLDQADSYIHMNILLTISCSAKKLSQKTLPSPPGNSAAFTCDKTLPKCCFAFINLSSLIIPNNVSVFAPLLIL